MTANKEFPISGKHPDTEEAILLYLYERPEDKHSTRSLASVLDDHSFTPEQFAAEVKASTSLLRRGEVESVATPKRKPDDVQKDIESLIVKGLVRGTREGTPGNIRHADIQLTPKGEREAIVAKNRPKRFVVDLM